MDEKPNLRDVAAAFVRRAVALAAGAVLAWLARRAHIVLDPETSQTGVMFFVALAGAAYGTVVNALETRFPWAGWFLGLARAPKYPKASTR